MYNDKLTLDSELKKLFPFNSHYLTLPDGEFMHYVDEGQGPVLLLLHGNPTWPFFYRKLIAHFRHFYRVIAPSPVGLGLSSRPQKYNYTLKQHAKNLSYLLKHLGVDQFSLVAHDWGGAIGLSCALEMPKKHKSIDHMVLMNTAAFRSSDIPKRIALCKKALIGPWLVRALNGFVTGTVLMAARRPLSPSVSKAYLFPYKGYRRLIGVSAFIQDIPLDENHPSYDYLKKLESNLELFQGPKLLLWGAKDFCFNLKFLEKWKSIYPDAEVITLKRASHLLLEDEGELCTQIIDDFLKEPMDEKKKKAKPFKVLWDKNRPLGEKVL